MQIIVQAGVDDLPFTHRTVPSYRRTAAGLDVPCDGPKLLALDDAGDPICAGCDAPVIPSRIPPKDGKPGD